MIATLGGILEGDSEEAIQQQLDRLTDAAGTFYRYALSASQLGSQRERGSRQPVRAISVCGRTEFIPFRTE